MRMLLSSILVLIVSSMVTMGQTVIDNFDSANPGTDLTSSVEGGLSKITLTQNTSDKHEGTSSLYVNVKIGAYHPWGSYSNVGYRNTANATMDWSLSDSLSIWIKVLEAPTHPEYMVMRISLDDRPTASDPRESYIYENLVIVDATSDWVNLRVPILERNQPGTDIPDGTGFILAPTSWGGFTYNNRKLDRNKIYQWTISFVTSGYTAGVNLPTDSLEVLLDDFTRFGARAVPVILFNGKDFTAPALNSWALGNSSLTVETGAGPKPKTNAIKFVEGSGWTGWGSDLTPTNMYGSWKKDSLHITYKAEAGGDPTLRAQFESANGKRGIKFNPIRDNQWHDIAIALGNMTFDDGSPNFDTTAVNKFGLMSDGNGVAGKVIYFTNIWTGNPVFDVIPPDPPSNVQANGADYRNLITWDDPIDESGSKYNIYYSEKAWIDYTDSTVSDLPPYNIPYGSQQQEHYLRAPNTDQNVTYYYGIVSKDAAGNESIPGFASSPTTTLAKGVPTISLTVPSNFAADGDLSEWASIRPFDLNTQKMSAHEVPNFPITDSLDLSAKAYVAIDADYLYVAFDVYDDIVLVDTTATNDYEQDCPDIFIGLYDWRGKSHSGYSGGAKPEYHLRFSKNRIRIDNGGTILDYAKWGTTGAPNYAWIDKILESGYVVEARIPLRRLAGALASRNDVVCVPVEGMRIPIDFAINDKDESNKRNGILCYSIITNDNSWSDMFYWTHTWIGNRWTPLSVIEQKDNIAREYTLSQNFPNPLNPSTKINYSLKKPGMVSIKVFDMLGREITTLVQAHQAAGSYTVSFNTMDYNLSSGIYFYRLESGSFVAMNKMILLK